MFRLILAVQYLLTSVRSCTDLSGARLHSTQSIPSSSDIVCGLARNPTP